MYLLIGATAASPLAAFIDPSITATQVETRAQRAVQQSWQLYQRTTPEAFSSGASGLGRTSPRVVFARSQVEFDNIAQQVTGNRLQGATAFVDMDNPSVFYVNVPRMTALAGEQGAQVIDDVVAHELAHLVTSGMLRRARADMVSTDPSSAVAKSDLSRTFAMKGDERAGIKPYRVSVQALLGEFSADYFAQKATGRSIASPYAEYKAIGQALIARVGEPTFRKAMLENDPASYQKVLQGMRKLSEEAALTEDIPLLSR